MKIEGVAAVTGAGQGIGLGVTEALARQGFDVLALVLEESMVKLHAMECTVSDRGLRWGLLADRFKGAA